MIIGGIPNFYFPLSVTQMELNHYAVFNRCDLSLNSLEVAQKKLVGKSWREERLVTALCEV